MSIETILKIKSPISQAKRTVVQILYAGEFFRDQLNGRLKPFNLTSQQYNVLRILRGQKGNPATLSIIQERMINKNSNTTRLIDKLVDKKLVSRKVDLENRRKLKITITKKGLKTLLNIDPKVDDFESKATYNLTNKELKNLNKLLDKLIF
ncbi:MAG: MarR family transcriptional regulator [Bacteroidia bacterium]|nr:MarR family transcriptional regulator [Bacteroidia bacterium]MBT8278317.1 MarR family transcriptional regulator [Bacteroidia bacterium]NND26123.1 MarR family transcriptional regulator [Flavobacteriaceae bacterium]NNK60064.1 MarR family transcriptional regulator [Flavobacteriaceae bacterium]NNL34122.1 MarR family transcriptional regulator [Flavobacteriaceae bacterium]